MRSGDSLLYRPKAFSPTAIVALTQAMVINNVVKSLLVVCRSPLFIFYMYKREFIYVI